MDKVHIFDVRPDSYTDKIIKLTDPKTTLDEFKKILKTISVDFIAQNTIYEKIPIAFSSCIIDAEQIFMEKGDGVLKILYNRHKNSHHKHKYLCLTEKMKTIFKLKDANLNIQDAKGNTILHIFAKNIYGYYHEYIMCLFKSMVLNFRFDFNIKNNQGMTALDIAKKNQIINCTSKMAKAIEDRMEIEKKSYLTVWCIKKQKLAPKDIQWMIWKEISKFIVVDF